MSSPPAVSGRSVAEEGGFGGADATMIATAIS